MIDKLLVLGADPNAPDINGDTPLIKTIWLTMSSSSSDGATNNRQEIFKLVKRLVASGANVNAVNESGRTPLFTSIYQNNTEIALYLLENGATCTESNEMLQNNFTLLHYACFQGNYKLAKALLERNCDPNAMSSSRESAIYIAVTKGYLDIVSLLVAYNADVNMFIGTDCDNKCTGKPN
jgi:ankyrin repeat protein